MPMEDYDKRLQNLDEALKNSKSLEEKQAKNADSHQAAKVISELFSGIIVGLFLGYQLDKYLETIPLFMIILTILGLIGAFWNIYKNIEK